MTIQKPRWVSASRISLSFVWAQLFYCFPLDIRHIYNTSNVSFVLMVFQFSFACLSVLGHILPATHKSMNSWRSSPYMIQPLHLQVSWFLLTGDHFGLPANMSLACRRWNEFMSGSSLELHNSSKPSSWSANPGTSTNFCSLTPIGVFFVQEIASEVEALSRATVEDRCGIERGKRAGQFKLGFEKALEQSYPIPPI